MCLAKALYIPDRKCAIKHLKKSVVFNKHKNQMLLGGSQQRTTDNAHKLQ